jgi:hypothetical protein
VLELSNLEWKALYNRVLHTAWGMTRTDDPKQAFMQRDRAQEAVQQAWMRYLRLRPEGLDTPDAVREYVLRAVRSSLGHAAAREQTSREIQGKAVVEEATITGISPVTTPSVEASHLAKGVQLADQARASTLLRRLKKRLKQAGDTLGLSLLDCIARRIVEPEQQARELGCDVQEIYNARKRRKRAMEQVLSDYAKNPTEPDDGHGEATS